MGVLFRNVAHSRRARGEVAGTVKPYRLFGVTVQVKESVGSARQATAKGHDLFGCVPTTPSGADGKFKVARITEQAVSQRPEKDIAACAIAPARHSEGFS